jgi:hypothetical protein
MVDRMGVVLPNTKKLERVYGPICVGGDWYSIYKDLKANRFDLRYAICKLPGKIYGFNKDDVISTSLTLLGAKLYLWKLAKFR